MPMALACSNIWRCNLCGRKMGMCKKVLEIFEKVDRIVLCLDTTRGRGMYAGRRLRIFHCQSIRRKLPVAVSVGVKQLDKKEECDP